MHYKTYTFKTTLTDVNGYVKIGATKEDTQNNLKAALELDTGAGTLYAASMTHSRGLVTVPGVVHQTVTMGSWSVDDKCVVTAVEGSTSNVQLNMSTSSGGRASWSGLTSGGLTGGESIAFNTGSLFSHRGPKTSVAKKQRRNGTNLVVTGQSINVVPLGNCWGYQLQSALSAAGHVVGFDNYSWGGTTFAERGDIQTELQELVFGFKKNILFIWGGHSDAQDGRTGQQIYDDKGTLANTARDTYGYDAVIALTIPDSLWIAGSEKTEYLTNQNVLLLDDVNQGTPYFDAVVDIYGETEMQDASNSTYFVDGVHFTSAGAQVVSDKVEAMIGSYLWTF
jgi:lysophospholipase L1-like esterase